MQRAAIGIARAGVVGEDFSARTKAGIQQSSRSKAIESASVIVEVIALPAGRAVESDAEPRKILDDCVFEHSLRSRGIGIFDSEPQRAAGRARRAFVAKRRIGVAEMQSAIGRGREAKGGAQGGLQGG